MRETNVFWNNQSVVANTATIVNSIRYTTIRIGNKKAMGLIFII